MENIILYLISSKNNKEYDDDVKLVLTYEEFEKCLKAIFEEDTLQIVA